MFEYNRNLNKADLTRGRQVAAWFPDYRRWPEENNLLKVYFLNNCPWKYNGRKIKHDQIVTFLKDNWKCFVKCSNKEDSQIRVSFNGM